MYTDIEIRLYADATSLGTGKLTTSSTCAMKTIELILIDSPHSACTICNQIAVLIIFHYNYSMDLLSLD